MRFKSKFDFLSPTFTLTCPGYHGAGSSNSATKGEGTLTFTIGSQVVAQIGNEDLLESWDATAELTPAQCARMAIVAADHLTEILDSGLPSADLAEAVTDAAVVFLLAMRRNGIADPKRIPACTVRWHGPDQLERVDFAI